jgi:hypothetical protein
MMMDICRYPAVADDVRVEIVRVIGNQGWTKAALYDLKLRDRFMKEGQRVHSFTYISIQRSVEQDAFTIGQDSSPKNSRIMFASDCMEPDAQPP